MQPEKPPINDITLKKRVIVSTITAYADTPISVTMGYILFYAASGSHKGDKMFENVPDEMKKFPNWVLWKYTARDGKMTKIPYHPNGDEASVSPYNTWSFFDCDRVSDPKGMIGYSILNRFNLTKEYDGIGFVFTEDAGFIGVDFDHIRDPITGKWNIEEIKDALSLNSYTEISPSGNGLHVICRGIKPGTACKAGDHEMYSSRRYFTITGKMFPGCNPAITTPQDAINKLYSKWFGYREQKQVNNTEASVKVNVKELQHTTLNNSAKLTDVDIIGICNNAKNSTKFKRLFTGDTSGYKSPSEADFALCRILAFYTSDSEQIERIMRSSGLIRAKWDQRGYISTTIRNALNAGGAKYGR